MVAAEGVRLARVGGVPLVFVPDRQGLFEAEPFLTGLWPRLRAGLSVEQFRAAARSGQKDGARMLCDLLDAGVVTHITTKDGPQPVTSRSCIDLGALRLGLNFSGSGDIGPLRDMVAHLEVSGEACDRHVVVTGTPDRIGVAPSGEAIDWYRWEQAAPALKMILTDLALQAIGGVALHVATLSEADEALLLVGAPGAGKSTLAVALGTAGFRLDGDDIAALQPDGRVTALPFPATVKDGAWGALAAYRSDLMRWPAYVRPDGQRVRYLALEPGAPPARRVRTVLCLDRTDAAPSGLTPIGVQDAVASLLAGAWSADKRLAPRDFEALTACVGGAHFYRMTYAKLGDAVALVRTAWESAESSLQAVAR